MRKIKLEIAVMFNSTISTLFFICIIGFGIFWFSAIIIWILAIRSYLERHGQKPGFLLFQWSFTQDYRRALDLARKRNEKPWFLKAFLFATVIAILFLVCAMSAVTIEGIKGH